MNIQPFGDRVLVRILQSETAKVGNLYVASESPSNKGIVVAVGEGVTLPDGSIRPLSVTVGDVVIFTPNIGVSYESGDDTFKILHVRDIVGKIVGEN